MATASRPTGRRQARPPIFESLMNVLTIGSMFRAGVLTGAFGRIMSWARVFVQWCRMLIPDLFVCCSLCRIVIADHRCEVTDLAMWPWYKPARRSPLKSFVACQELSSCYYICSVHLSVDRRNAASCLGPHVHNLSMVTVHDLWYASSSSVQLWCWYSAQQELSEFKKWR